MTSPLPPSAAKRPPLLPDLAGVICLVVFATLALAGGEKMLHCPDTLWHIKAGTIMLEQKAILTHDIFSHTAYGKEWIAHEWLAEVIMALLHRSGGLPAVVLFYSLLAAFSFHLLSRLCSRSAPDWLATLCVLSALPLAYSHLLARPHLFTWLFGLITLAILHKGTHSRQAYILPPLTALWANLHGGFVLGISLQGIFLAGQLLNQLESSPRQWRSLFDSSRKPLFILLASILAACLTPFGYHLLLFPFQVSSGSFAVHISEWAPPNLQQEWPFRVYLLLVFLILLFRPGRIDWTRRLLILFLINASLTHGRHVSLAGLFLSPIWADALSAWARGLKQEEKNFAAGKELPFSSRSGPIATLILFLILLSLSAFPHPLPRNLLATLFPMPKSYPAQALAYLESHPPKGKMFNSYALGGPIIYTFGTRYKVFIDGRADMYGEKIFNDYIQIKNINEQTDSLLQSYGIDWIFHDSSAPLISYLKKCASWQEVYRDKTASILVRRQNTSPSD